MRKKEYFFAIIIFILGALLTLAVWPKTVRWEFSTPQFGKVNLELSHNLYDALQKHLELFKKASERYEKGEMNPEVYNRLTENHNKIIEILLVMAGKIQTKGAVGEEPELLKELKYFEAMYTSI